MTVSWENPELVPVPLPSEISVGGAGMSILSGNIAHAGGSVDHHWSSMCWESDTAGMLNFLLESRRVCVVCVISRCLTRSSVYKVLQPVACAASSIWAQ